MPESKKTVRSPKEIEIAARATRDNFLKHPLRSSERISRDSIIKYCDEVLSITEHRRLLLNACETIKGIEDGCLSRGVGHDPQIHRIVIDVVRKVEPKK
jgi:hypothetical protein